MSQAAALGMAVAASGYTSTRVEDHYRGQALQEMVPTLAGAVHDPEVRTRLALREHRAWPLVASARTQEGDRGRLLSAYAEWRRALETHPGAYQLITQERSFCANVGDNRLGGASRLAVRVRATPNQTAFLSTLEQLRAAPGSDDIIVEHVKEDVIGMNEHQAIEEALQRLTERVQARQTTQAQDAPSVSVLDPSRPTPFLQRLSSQNSHTVELIDHPMTRAGRPTVVAELHVSDMVVYVNNIRILRIGRGAHESARGFRLTADILRDNGARFASHRE